MTWWSLTKCHIQTAMIQKNSHGHGMLPIVSIKRFPFWLKKLFHFKNHQVSFDAPCIWYEPILPFTPVMELDCKWLVVCISQ